MPHPLDTSLLRTLVAIADHGSFAHAGHHVNLSQSTVSLQMKRLEEQVATVLFIRHGRRMVLTEEGLSLVRYARRILALDHEAQAALAGAQFVGPVRLGMIQDLTEELLSEILAQFARSNPGVRLEIKVSNSQDLNDALVSGQLDLALVAGQQSRATPLFRREKLLWIGSDSLAKPSEAPVPLAVCSEPCGVRQNGNRTFRNGGAAVACCVVESKSRGNQSGSARGPWYHAARKEFPWTWIGPIG